jgi:dTDP-4-amino-4,6-dideoxygalactose transaminase
VVQGEFMKVRLAKPSLGRGEIRAVSKVLRSGLLVQGVCVERFEKELGRVVGARHVVVVSSGTAALHVALLALGIGPGDEVIVPDFTFPASANTVAMAGAVPVLVDVDPVTFNIDPERIEAAVTRKTRAIMPVHLFGLAADMRKVMAIARRKKLMVLEDAACALGASVGGKSCGAFAEAGCFSFHPRKIMTTGEGGAVVTNDVGLAHRLRLLRSHGMEKLKGRWPDLGEPGLNYRMTEMQAAIGLEQLRRLPALRKERQRIAELYRKHLSHLPMGLPAGDPDERVYQSYVVSLPVSIDRDKVVDALRRAGVEATIGTYALHRLKHYRDLKSRFPGADQVFSTSLSLPVPTGLAATDVRRIVRVLETCLSKASR